MREKTERKVLKFRDGQPRRARRLLLRLLHMRSPRHACGEKSRTPEREPASKALQQTIHPLKNDDCVTSRMCLNNQSSYLMKVGNGVLN